MNIIQRYEGPPSTKADRHYPTHITQQTGDIDSKLV